MAWYMTKREHVDAMQFDGTNIREVLQWAGNRDAVPFDMPAGFSLYRDGFGDQSIHIATPGGILSAGKWAIKPIADGLPIFSIMDNDRFHARYIRYTAASESKPSHSLAEQDGVSTSTPTPTGDAELSDLRASNARMADVLSSIRDRLGLDDGGSILDALDDGGRFVDPGATCTFLLDGKRVELADLPKGEVFNLVVKAKFEAGAMDRVQERERAELQERWVKIQERQAL